MNPHQADAIREVSNLIMAAGDLERAIVAEDDTYIVGDLQKISWHREQALLTLMAWRPTLRMSPGQSRVTEPASGD
jgi:hypothetical protein